MPSEPAGPDLFGPHIYAKLVAETRDFAIFLVDLQGCVTSWNEGARLLFGYEREEIVGQSATQLFVPEDRESGVPEHELETAAREGRADDMRWHLRKDGSRFWANGVTTALFGEAGELIGFSKVARDETARKAMEDELSKTARQLQTALGAGRIGTWTLKLPGNQIVGDGNLGDFFGIPAENVVSSPIEAYLRAIHPDDAPRVEAAIRQSIEDGTHFSEDYRVMRSDGSILWMEARGKMELDAHDRPLQLDGVVVDISERKGIEAALRQSQERYSALFEAIDSGFCIIQVLFDENNHPVDYRFLETNPAFQEQTGLENAVGRTVRELVPDLDEFWFQAYGKVALTGQPVHFENAAEAMQRFFDVHAFRVGKPEDRQVAVLFSEISFRKKSESEREELLRKLEFERGRLAAIFQGAPAFVAVLRGPEYVFEIANPAYYQLVGHRPIVGKPLLEALPEIEGQGYVELLDNVLYRNEPWEGREMEVQLQREPGGPFEERFVDLLYQPLVEADGTVSGIFAHGMDITEQVRARRSAEEANRVKDEFLATLSHELRTPLTAIMGWANILQSDQVSPDEIERGLATIERNARAQAQLVEDILDVSRVITGKLRLEVQPVDLDAIIEEAVSTVTPAAQAKNIHLQSIVEAGDSLVSGDPARLQQIVWNLLSNAIKFTPREGKVQIRLERTQSQVEIVVSDSGVGIAPAVLPFVFERFRQADSTSTRSHGGLGLGLAIVRHLAELHGGSVEAHSAGVGQGATFTVKLPLVAVRSFNKRASDTSEQLHTNGDGDAVLTSAPRLDGLHVLAVDDQEDTRILLTAVLEKCGARVTVTSSAPEALYALQTLRPDVLLSDIGMPGEDGFSFIKRVRALPKEQGGQIPAAALTAFARVEDRVKVLRCGFQIHIPKPVEPVELATVVANLAGRREES